MQLITFKAHEFCEVENVNTCVSADLLYENTNLDQVVAMSYIAGLKWHGHNWV